MDFIKTGFLDTVEHLAADGQVKTIEQAHNLIPTEGANYMLNTALMGGSAFTSWYMGLFEASRAPALADTLAALIADGDEVVTYTTDAGRLPITLSAASAGATSTTASPNIFVFPAAATVRGAFITSGSAFGGTTGLLLSVALFSATKTLAAGESLRVPAGFALTSA